MAKLKGARRRRVLLVHALPNSIAPTIQVIGLNLLYLAGGIVVVEYVFNYPGIGAGLVDDASRPATSPSSSSSRSCSPRSTCS